MADPGIHIIIFCKSEYRNAVSRCVQSVETFVKDIILSRTIVSNRRLEVDGYELVLDHNFWQLFDPDFVHSRLYNINWIKQQLFKLQVDQLVSGNVLILDAEVLFINDTNWMCGNQSTLYTTYSPHCQAYFDFIKDLVDQTQVNSSSCISDAMIFNTDVLIELRQRIQQLHQQQPYLETIDKLVSKHGSSLSEFELYGNYVTEHHPELVGSIVGPNKHRFVIDNWADIEFDTLVETARALALTNNKYITLGVPVNNAETHWLSFYQLIKDASWPECDNEADFDLLPDEIKKECRDKFGYQQSHD